MLQHSHRIFCTKKPDTRETPGFLFCIAKRRSNDFRDQLRSLGNEGDLESLSVEGCFCLMHQLGVQDETLRRELCKIKNPLLAEFDTLLEAHALMEASEKHRNKNAQVNMTKGPQRKSPPNPNKIRLSEEERKRRKLF